MSYELHCGDALQVMATLPAASVNAIITDLPYGTTACAWDAVIPFVPMWEAVKRLLKPGGVFVTTASQPFTSALVMSNLEWFRDEWIWRKNRGGDVFNAKRRPLKFHEQVLVFADGLTIYNPQGLTRAEKVRVSRKAGSEFYANKDKAAYVQEYEHYPTTFLDFSITESVHPTQKPVALYAYLIRTYTHPGDAVADICCGSGTTGVAAIKEGRRFIGIERDANYYAIAQRRLQDASAQPMLFEVTA